MLTVCAWCKRPLKESGDASDGRMSHGICETCESHLAANVDGIPLQEFLDTISVPIALVDSDVRVVYANSSAQAIVDKPAAEIEHRLGGEVFECDNSYLPGGCGHTASCSACTFRNAVTRCYESGTGEESVLTTITRRTPDGTAELAMRISTKRINDRVLVTIDEVVTQH